MIYIHTYEVNLIGDKDFIQFYEYEIRGMHVCESLEIDLALISPNRGILNSMMIGAIKQQFFEDCGLKPTVRHNSTLFFDENEQQKQHVRVPVWSSRA